MIENNSIPKTVAKFAIPTILSQLVTLLYNLADTFFVGHTNDPSQVAALTLSFPLFMSLTMVGNLFGIGANSFISRSLGQGNKKNASKASTFAFYGALMGVVLLISILCIFITPILHTIGAKTDAAFKATKAYLMWTVVYGGLPTVAALMLGHLIRAEGNTKQASIGLAIGGVLNIGLDYIFVSLMGLGAEGAAIATCISNVVSFIYMVFIVHRNHDSIIVLNPLKLVFEKYIIKQVILVGIPAATIIILGSFANIVLTHFMSPYGDVSIAAFGIVQKIGTIAIQITVGLTQGIMPLLGYCYGANDIKRMKAISNFSFILLACYATFCLLIVEIFAKPFIMLFISEGTTVSKGIEFVRVWFLCAPGMCFTNLFGSIFQAMGKWFHSFILSVIRQVGLLFPLLIVMNKYVGEFGLVCAQPIADTISLFIGIILYVTLMKKITKKRESL
ncbi:MAG: polysaccharide biosynthesis C-terminal domain-containing protein [Lachnospiraceae bacterium]|nr:polysaccharide biosynthesis C-terminal domain-containing protein [Lachnospiraceae bacterium]